MFPFCQMFILPQGKIMFHEGNKMLQTVYGVTRDTGQVGTRLANHVIFGLQFVLVLVVVCTVSACV